MRRVLSGLYLGCGWLAGIFLLAIAVMVLAQVTGRLFGVLVPWADEFAGFCLGATSFLALSYTFRAGGHVRVSLLLQHWSPPRRRLAELWCLAASTALAGYFAFYLAWMVWESFVFGDVGQAIIPTPLWIPQTAMALGAAAFCVALAHSLVEVLMGESPAYMAGEKPQVERAE